MMQKFVIANSTGRSVLSDVPFRQNETEIRFTSYYGNGSYTYGQKYKDLFIFYEIWKDQAGLDKHNQQPYILDFGQLVHEKLQETPQIYLTNKI